MYKNVQDINNFIMKAVKKPESGIKSNQKNFSRTENPEWYLVERCAVAITICNRNDAVHLHTWPGDDDFIKSQGKINHLCN